MEGITGMIVADYIIKFIIFSFIGWIYECTYCTITTGHWDNRGFLFGPICPIYGIGALGAMVVFNEIPVFHGGDTPMWKVFFICMFGSAVLEYIVSFILEKRFHAMWWDYSNVPFNIKGRICLPASLGFGVAGVVLVKYFFPWFLGLTGGMSLHPIINEIIASAFIFILGMDLAVSVASITELLSYLDDVTEKFDERMEASVEMVTSAPGVIKEKMTEAPDTIKEKIQEAPEVLREKISDAPEALKEKITEAPMVWKEKMSEAPNVFREKVQHMNRKQKHHLRSITTFKMKEKTQMFEKLKKALKEDENRER
ncbi:MAG: hypothetical protein K5675_08105 [Lachnospiraceae bacterium]|nr:hypothetical protein [Lachnospiraceae bacterium]